MATLNRAEIIGYLGQDPELRNTQSGKSVVTLSVATSYKPKDGEEQTEWHRVTVWGKSADNCDKYLKKGSLVYVDGRLQTRKWEDDKGVTRYTTEIVAFMVQFLDRKEGGSGGGRRNDPPPPDDDDDIPF